MKLSVFIRAHMTAILSEWTAFAEKAAPAEGTMSALALTDHAQGILLAIARDIDTAQNAQQQFDKSQGEDVEQGDEETAAAIHGRLRHASNFSLLQLSSEFRALRATVLRLWLKHVDDMSDSTMEDMVRFNEAIDQALAESIVTYSARAERTRDLFLGVLGHDLRAPIATVSLLGELLIHAPVSPEQAVTLGQRAKRSATTMNAMVTDLLGYTRLQMGAGMPIIRAACDMLQVCRDAAADARAMYPAANILLRHTSDLAGAYDAVRVQQLVTNLLINAAQYSTAGRDITLTVDGVADAVQIRVHNFGPPIPPEALETVFKPLVQLDADVEDDERPRSSLGLGLFIAREIATIHGGDVSVRSATDAGTTFFATLPRTA